MLSQGESAIQHGATLVTHLFNAMNAFHHRDLGLAGLITTNIFEEQNAHYGIIADGIHIHREVVKLAYKANFDRMCLITDGISAMGLTDGFYLCGQQKLEVKGGRAVVAGTDTLIGAICNLWEAVNNLRDWTDCSWVHALQSASLHPARALLKNKEKGTLNFDADADFIMIDLEKCVLISTRIAGCCVYESFKI